MSNDRSTNATGIRDVHLENKNGSRLILKNVKHVPDIFMNLFSSLKRVKSKESEKRVKRVRRE